MSELDAASIMPVYSVKPEYLTAAIESILELVRRTGSAAYDLSCVAAGRSDGFMELDLHLYDYAAGYVILREAGGQFSGWDFGEDGLATGNIMASNGLLHDFFYERLSLD